MLEVFNFNSFISLIVKNQYEHNNSKPRKIIKKLDDLSKNLVCDFAEIESLLEISIEKASKYKPSC